MTKFDWKRLHKELEDTLKNMTPQDWKDWEAKRKAGEEQYNEAQRAKTPKTEKG